MFSICHDPYFVLIFSRNCEQSRRRYNGLADKSNNIIKNRKGHIISRMMQVVLVDERISKLAKKVQDQILKKRFDQAEREGKVYKVDSKYKT